MARMVVRLRTSTMDTIPALATPMSMTGTGLSSRRDYRAGGAVQGSEHVC